MVSWRSGRELAAGGQGASWLLHARALRLQRASAGRLVRRRTDAAVEAEGCPNILIQRRVAPRSSTGPLDRLLDDSAAVVFTAQQRAQDVACRPAGRGDWSNGRARRAKVQSTSRTDSSAGQHCPEACTLQHVCTAHYCIAGSRRRRQHPPGNVRPSSRRRTTVLLHQWPTHAFFAAGLPVSPVPVAAVNIGLLDAAPALSSVLRQELSFHLSGI